MEYSMWAYPWDIIDEGVDTVADRLTTVGVSEVNVATNYHSIQTFNPHNPARRTFFSHASAYFHPGDEYGRLKPIPNEMMGDDDWLATIDKGLRDTPLDLNSWTIGCHNSRLGEANHDLTLESPHGDSLIFGLCPSQPAVREYLVSLLRDLDSLADVMDKKPEEELVEKLQKTVADLREQAEEEQVGETPGAPHYSHCNGILRACKRIEEEFNL